MSKPKDVAPKATDAPLGALSRADFLTRGAALPLPKERVPCPELGGYLCLSELGASRRDLWEDAILVRAPGKANTTDYTDWRAKALALSLWDEVAGDWMCTLADVPEIGKMPTTVIQRAFDVFVRINAIKAEDLAELEAQLKNALSVAG